MSLTGTRPLVLNFVAPSTRHPSGGVAVVYEFASAMAQRGHTVHLFHAEFFQGNVRGLDDIAWFEFDPAVHHHFAPDGAPEETIPDADVLFGFAPERASLTRIGLPVVLIQGYRMLGTELEAVAFRAPCPKICVASWLVDVALELGVAREELVHIPVGLRTSKYRLRRPIADRPRRIAYCYSSHRQKGPDLALGTLRSVQEAVPDVEITLYGAVAPEHEIPRGMTYRTDPPQAELVEDIYNGSSIFLNTSEVEGFGLTSIEAMACGAALVTTDNGGSRDYAIHGRTALVAPVGDRAALADHVVTLLRDDSRRVEIASNGHRAVQRFSWEHSGELLEDFLLRYLAGPSAFAHPDVGNEAVGGHARESGVHR